MLTEKELEEGEYYGYVIVIAFQFFMNVERDHRGKRIPLFTTAAHDARIYENEDNAKTIFQWVCAWFRDNKDRFGQYNTWPHMEKVRLRPWMKNIKWEEDSNGKANSN